MDYVLVPVPEEHVAATRQYLAWNTGKIPAGSLEPEVVERVLAGLDDRARALLVVAAEASDKVEVVTAGQAAEAIGCSVREVLGLTLEINEATRLAGGPPFIMSADVQPGVEGVTSRDWKINMPGDVAWRMLAVTGNSPKIET